MLLKFKETSRLETLSLELNSEVHEIMHPLPSSLDKHEKIENLKYLVRSQEYSALIVFFT